MDLRVWEHLGKDNEVGSGSEHLLASEPQPQSNEPPLSVGESINFTPEVIEELMDDIKKGIMGG